MAHAETCNASASGVAFGTYTPNQALPLDSSGTVTVNCTKGVLDLLPLTVSYTISLSRGGGPTYAPRQMSNGTNPLAYNLYSDLLRTTVWGDGTGGSSKVSALLILPIVLGTGTGIHSVFGRIPANQNAYPGAYTDTVVVTVTY